MHTQMDMKSLAVRAVCMISQRSMKPNWLQMTEPQSPGVPSVGQMSRSRSRLARTSTSIRLANTWKKRRKLAQSSTFHTLLKYSLKLDVANSITSSMMK